MAGAQIEYDEGTGTFFYFLLSVLALILIPATYYWWPRNEKHEDTSKQKKQCRCKPCEIKNSRAASKEPWDKVKKTTIQCVIVFGWILLALLAYKVANMERDHIEYNPFEVLEIDRGASVAEIKKQYRKLSLIYHPDKDTGDPVRFMKIAKAYAALTDEESRKNWEMYGNPDGPGATTFGIALPSWIIEKKNSVWVLAVYLLLFMVALPIVVGTWWYRSIRYTGEQILLDTTYMYYYYFHKTPSMNLKRVIMILGASSEFNKAHNSEIIERPSDDVFIPQLIKEFPNLGEKNKERPLCFGYSIKARVLLYAHFYRMPLTSYDSLDIDQHYILKKCPFLIQEMINCIAQLIVMLASRGSNQKPTLETIEKCMKFSQMVIQAVWENPNPLLQLPHFTDDILRHGLGKKRTIRSIRQLATLKKEERRSALKSFSEEQYQDIMNVISKMPHIDMSVKLEVLDDEDSLTITAGSLVTVTVVLTREPMEVLFEKEVEEEETEELQVDDKSCGDYNTNKNSPVQKKSKGWEKQKKKKGKVKKKKGFAGSGKGGGSTKIVKKIISKPGESANVGNHTESTDKTENIEAAKESDSDSSGVESDDSDTSNNIQNANHKDEPKEEEDDENWKKIQSHLTRKEKVLETKSKVSHPVHCPYFPEDKQEWWWLYIADRRHRQLVTPPTLITSLVSKEEVHLRFPAPPKPGNYTYLVVLKSDSYIDFDQTKNIVLDVKEEKAVQAAHPQWGSSDDEKEDHEVSEASDYTTEEDSD